MNGKVPDRDLFGGFDSVSVLATLCGPGCVYKLPVLRGWRGVDKLWITFEDRRVGTGCGIARSQSSGHAGSVHLKSGVILSAAVARREQAGG